VRLLLTAVLALMLCSIAYAASESHPLGPYTVSFDLNTNTKYDVQTAQPMENQLGKAYSMGIITDNSTFAVVGITDYNELADSTLKMHKELLKMNTRLSGLNVTSTQDMTIDGKEGFEMVSTPLSSDMANTKYYRGLYWLDSKNCECGPVSVGKTVVMISSTYPEDVTNNLLKSIKVAKS
jgi:hypothetical protein